MRLTARVQQHPIHTTHMFDTLNQWARTASGEGEGRGRGPVRRSHDGSSMKSIPVAETVAACVSILDSHLLMTLSKREVGSPCLCERGRRNVSLQRNVLSERHKPAGAGRGGRKERLLFLKKWRVQTWSAPTEE